MRRPALILLSALFFVNAGVYLARQVRESAPEAKDVARLKEREDQYTQGIIRKDVKLLGRVFADTFVDTFSTGQLVDKQHYLDLIKADTSKIETLNVEDQKYQFYGNTAIVTAKFRVNGIDEGKPFDIAGRSTDVWIKVNGDWFCVAAHSCLVKQ